MKINLTQDEIQDSIAQYLENNFNIPSNQISSIEFTAGRGDNGMSASVNFANKAENTAKATKQLSSNEPEVAQSKESVVESVPEVKETVKETASEPKVDIKNLFGD